MLTDRCFGVELEVIVPGCPSQLPGNGCHHDRVAALLRQHGINAMSKAELKANPRADASKVWIVTPDDSLEPETEAIQGTEIVSPILQGEDDMKTLKQVVQTLKDTGFNTNMLTGLHVHHDAQDLDIPAWKRLMVNYFLAEPAFDRLVSFARRGNQNTHALSTRQQEDIEPMLDEFDDELTVDDICKQIFPGVRSNHDLKLNVDAFEKHGTVEFRQHEGTLDPDAVEHWVRLTQAFVDHSVNSPELISVNTGITDPLEAWEEVSDERPAAQNRLLGNLLNLVGRKTRAHFEAVVGRHDRAPTPPAWAMREPVKQIAVPYTPALALGA